MPETIFEFMAAKPDNEFKTYCAARHAYKNRVKKTPKGTPWPIWFEHKFGYSLDDYITKIKSEFRKQLEGK